MRDALKAQCVWYYKGLNEVNEAFDLVHEFSMLEGMRKLGFGSNLNRLNVYKAECFAIIGNEFARLAREEAKRGKVNR